MAVTVGCVVTVLLGVLGCTHAFSMLTLNVQPQKQGLTCWTCPNKTNNEECNNWAPDRVCPMHEDTSTWCRTVHRFHVSGEGKLTSHVVSKDCVADDTCTAEHVGCVALDGIQECVSCCKEDYCNEAVPLSHEHALALSTATLSSGVSAPYPPAAASLVLCLTLLLTVVIIVPLNSPHCAALTGLLG